MRLDTLVEQERNTATDKHWREDARCMADLAAGRNPRQVYLKYRGRQRAAKDRAKKQTEDVRRGRELDRRAAERAEERARKEQTGGADPRVEDDEEQGLPTYSRSKLSRKDLEQDRLSDEEGGARQGTHKKQQRGEVPTERVWHESNPPRHSLGRRDFDKEAWNRAKKVKRGLCARWLLDSCRSSSCTFKHDDPEAKYNFKEELKKLHRELRSGVPIPERLRENPRPDSVGTGSAPAAAAAAAAVAEGPKPPTSDPPPWRLKQVQSQKPPQQPPQPPPAKKKDAPTPRGSVQKDMKKEEVPKPAARKPPEYKSHPQKRAASQVYGFEQRPASKAKPSPAPVPSKAAPSRARTAPSAAPKPPEPSGPPPAPPPQESPSPSEEEEFSPQVVVNLVEEGFDPFTESRTRIEEISEEEYAEITRLRQQRWDRENAERRSSQR